MLRIQRITQDSRQDKIINLPDGSYFTLNMYFISLQQGWFITELTYGEFTLRGVRITNNPNILQQYKNQIPFGLACFSAGSREPSLIEDFESNYSNLYVLTREEVDELSEFYSGA